MKIKGLMAAVCGGIAVLAFTGSGEAGDRQAESTFSQQGQMEPTKSRYQRKRAVRVRGFTARRGGYYSYTDSDVVNVYGGSRTLYGSTNFYRDPFVDRQTTSGPFDHDFFFDSGTGPRGGNAPYPR